MKIGVVIFPGTSGDRDLIHVFRNVLEQEVVELWHKDTDLQNADISLYQAALLMEIT